MTRPDVAVAHEEALAGEARAGEERGALLDEERGAMDEDVGGDVGVAHENASLARERETDDVAVFALGADDVGEGVRAEFDGGVAAGAGREVGRGGLEDAGDRARQLRGELGEVLQGTVLGEKRNEGVRGRRGGGRGGGFVVDAEGGAERAPRT